MHVSAPEAQDFVRLQLLPGGAAHARRSNSPNITDPASYHRHAQPVTFFDFK
jgi:hypothetical protein